jgi:glycosyltransferase involved in cell wall biosynthesis
MKNKILLLGPKTNIKNPSLTGGAVVLFENLLEQMQKQKINYIVIDTNKKNYSNTFVAYFSIIFQIFIKQVSVNHISLHSSKDYIFFAPIIIIIGKLFKKSTSLRKFGGEAWDTYRFAKGIKKKLLNFIFKNIDYLFLEMKNIANNFSKINKNTFWFPNVRNKPNIKIEEKNFSKKFVFISHVIKEKGIDEIVEVKKLLDDSYTIDIYGPLHDNKYTVEYFKNHGIAYNGKLKADEVLITLSKYDVLLLPSYKEGYPGIVIESYSIGIPIISTKLIGLKEIVDEYKTGILIEPKNVQELKNAIEYFNNSNYTEMSKCAKNKFLNFNSEEQTKEFIKTIRNNR